MQQIKWEPSLSVNVVFIDEEHRVLIELVNELQHALNHGEARETYLPMLERLGELTTEHFMHEEELMRKLHYGDYVPHKAEHDAFRSKLRKFRKSIESGKTDLSKQVLTYLGDWLKTHIQSTDRQYADSFNDGGVF